MATIFSKIINGDIPCYKIAENEHFFAFLDINPLAKGHTLVIPKVEVDYIFELSNDDYLGLMVFAKEVAGKIQRAVPCKRIGMAVIGLEVPHAHIHLVPLSSEGDLNFANPKLKLAKEEFELIAKNIRGE
jgi:histidine triad (HIT) family protein